MAADNDASEKLQPLSLSATMIDSR